jgi:hypothetical protein
MKKSLIAMGLILASVGILPAALHVYQVPDLAGGNEKPSIARNAQGDMLIVYRNNVDGAAFYYKRHDGRTLGPGIIAGQPYEPFAKRNVFVTDIVADPAGNFHAVWNFDIHKGAWGIYYAVFKIATESWSSPSRIVSGKIESPKLTINPLTNDLVLVYDCYLPGNKDVFLKVKTRAGWQKEVDISYDTQVEAPPSGPSASRAALAARAADDQTGIAAPHGALAETNAWVAVDRSDGYVYIIWKADKWNVTESKWELQIVVTLYDPSYKRVWLGRVTHEYEGFHVLPTIAAINGKSMMAFAWQQEAGYYYINFVRDGNTLVYDPSVLYDHRIAQCPITPHWEFFSYVVEHGNEMMFVYKDPAKQTNLLRFTPDGKRLDKLPIDLCDREPSLWPIDVFSDPEIGLLTVWATPREGDASIHYSIYDYPVTKISGTVKQDSKGLSGVTLTGLPEDPTTDSSGNYSTYIDPGWTGTGTPEKPGYRFEPPSREYRDVTSSQTGQDYAAVVQFDLTISAASGGTTTPPPATYPKDKNSLVTVRAVPGSSYQFDKWTGDASGSGNPITVKIDKNKSIRANFIKQFNLTISATSGGTTTPPPGTYPKEPDSLVTVTAVPSSNHRFANWTGDASGSGNPITVKIDKNKSIRANFIRIKSVANLQVEKRVERGYFSGYTLNVLTWEANPQNAAMGLAVSAQRVYRKARTEDNTKWARIAANLPGTVLRYEDNNVPKDSDYVYAVTCVDDKGNESAVY